MIDRGFSLCHNLSQMIFGLLKSGLDAHTLGLSSLAALLEDCGFKTFIADASTCHAIDRITNSHYFKEFKDWVQHNQISHLGFSYRLDPSQALETFGKLVYHIDNNELLSAAKNGLIKDIYFAGLPETCALIEKEFRGRFRTFHGDETPVETLGKLGIPEIRIPKSIREISVYDELRMEFGNRLIEEERQFTIQPISDLTYPEYGTEQDHLILRLEAAAKMRRLPLTRAHVGPYLQDREKALALFSDWLKQLVKSQLLDIVSVGSSQLSQSHFGEDWGDLPNGGGVPFNSELELSAIRQDAVPMLVRAYSATKNIPTVAQILEENLNMAWHALSLWWFNQIDGRGPLTVKQGLAEHLETLQYISQKGKPFEPNLPHHFAFRGADDITYIVSAYLAAKTAKLFGIKYLVLQNMLNTPKSTWGTRDLAKSRALLSIVRNLEDKNFKIIFQPRAGLDYFSPNLEKARIQLAAVTALMADVEPAKQDSPEIIHVVSYSEASFLANPDVVNESAQITKAALKHYSEFRKKHFIQDIILGEEISHATTELRQEAQAIIKDMEMRIPRLYSSDGLYQTFKMGYFPVPYLWEGHEEFSHAVDWNTQIMDGGVFIVDSTGHKMTVKDRLSRIKRLNTQEED